MYDSHSELELIQLQLKLFNLELKNNDPMALILDIREIMHDINTIGLNIDTIFVALIKVLYPT